MKTSRDLTTPRNRARAVARPREEASGPAPWLLALLVGLALLFMAAQAQARSAPDSFADLAEKLLPAVVNISTSQTIEGHAGPEMPQLPPGSPLEEFFKDFLDRNRPDSRPRRATSLGSGFIIDTKGYVVTNNHVIQDADEVTVLLHDNTRLQAEVVGRDPKTDLAVLKVEIDGKKLTAVEFGNSDKTRVGDWVLAIGNPFGLGGTVTAGIVSARGRDINSGPYDNYIQTDASINRGNSGGPMFDMKGRVIGINTAIYSPSGGSVGIGFAIPAESAIPVVNQLIEHGEVKRGWLGVHIQTVTEEIAESLGMKDANGALVANVTEDGPAARAGIKAGDVILTFDGRKVPEMRKLPRMVADAPVGKTVPVVLWRDGRKVTVKVNLGELDKGEAQIAERKERGHRGGVVTVEALGLALASPTDALRERFELDEEAKGVVVVKVDPDGPAAEKGLRPGDLILEVSQQEVSTPAEVKARVAKVAKEGGKPALLLVQGQGGLRFVGVRLDKKK